MNLKEYAGSSNLPFGLVRPGMNQLQDNIQYNLGQFVDPVKKKIICWPDKNRLGNAENLKNIFSGIRAEGVEERDCLLSTLKTRMG